MPGPGRPARSTAARPRRRLFWERYPTEQLLDVRLCDLGVAIEGTWLEGCLARLRAELDARDLRVRPTFYLADEWFSPDGAPGVAIPFYLAHPRLQRLERSQMLEAEGGNREWCLKLLRHETGHAVQQAWRLHRRRRWQQLFGRTTQRYPDHYRPNPNSTRHVQHLDAWYAQCHPDEDFAETFAVWLRPRSRWRERYRGWPALRKLEYVDELMGELAGHAPAVRSRARPKALSTLRSTLREHYRAKREHYSVGYSDLFDRDLLRLFSADPRHRRREKASAFLRRHRREIREQVARWTGQYQFTLDQVLREMIGRCRELRLRVAGPERSTKIDFAILLTVHTMQYQYRGRYWHAV